MQLEENSNLVKWRIYNDNLIRFEFSSNSIVHALYMSFII